MGSFPKFRAAVHVFHIFFYSSEYFIVIRDNSGSVFSELSNPKSPLVFNIITNLNTCYLKKIQVILNFATIFLMLLWLCPVFPLSIDFRNMFRFFFPEISVIVSDYIVRFRGRPLPPPPAQVLE